MIEVREVRSRKEQRQFVEFPVRLYKDNPCFVPPLYMDEMKMFRSDFVYNDTCETVFYNAYQDGKMVGRIAGIIQRAANEKNHEKRVRFSRLDGIDDPEVFKALLTAVEKWAREKGMDTVVGPLSFSDLEREGLLIEGFDQPSTFEEQYNAPYYQKHIEALGYEKEVDWTECRLYAPKEEDPTLKKGCDFIMKRYKLHFGEAKNANDFLRKYADGFFEILDHSYEDVYGTVPFTPGMKKLMIDNFRLIIDMEHVFVVQDENDRIVCFGICFPGIGEPVRKSKGHLTPLCIARILRLKKHARVVDLGLIGVEKDWLNRGVPLIFVNMMAEALKAGKYDVLETNLNLEDNFAVRNMWKHFNAVENKRRRAFVKKIQES
ncbi:MAG: hypothetical protein IJU49_05415 [Lachnospiraceae bacterium]|nr:hypothetical protein [Lachnospiraceae bacterium]MBQ7601581.1 hypothetical protein [Lachnospiraceae bacterium]